MNGRYLLDTNIVIALFANEPAVTDNLRIAQAVFIPGIVIGELYFGAYRSSRVETNLRRIEEFAQYAHVLSCDIETAQEYGRIKNILREAGRPIPENDIWIAAVASQHDLIVVSRDVHFDEVAGLTIEKW